MRLFSLTPALSRWERGHVSPGFELLRTLESGYG